jgi:hypothetical protein
VWSYRDGDLFLIGKMRVGRFISQREADALYRPEGLTAWKASEHILAEPGTGTPERYDLVVSPGIIRELRFLGQGRVSTVKYRGAGQIDPQTFRGLRELTPESARLLDNLLGSNNGKFLSPRRLAEGNDTVAVSVRRSQTPKWKRLRLRSRPVGIGIAAGT